MNPFLCFFQLVALYGYYQTTLKINSDSMKKKMFKIYGLGRKEVLKKKNPQWKCEIIWFPGPYRVIAFFHSHTVVLCLLSYCPFLFPYSGSLSIKLLPFSIPKQC